jgi:hypothetical protein
MKMGHKAIDKPKSSEKKAWQPMKLSRLGKATSLIKGGQGKLTPMLQDSGDVRKPPGQG